MTRTFLITSGAYVEPELEAEFGRLPPAFLPVGSRRLIQHQRDAIAGHADSILVSLPEGFTLDEADHRLLNTLGIEPVFVPEGLSLGQSIVYVINVRAAVGVPLLILHGDTLLRGIDFTLGDAVSVDRSPPPGYHWGAVTVGDDGARVLPDGGCGNSALTGYFHFSSTARLVQAVTRRGGDFIAGLADYTAARPMTPLVATEWLDFGHAGTYHRSRRCATTEREFNRLVTTPRTMVKSSTLPAKLEAEARWFEEVPSRLRLFTPAYLGRRGEGADMAYELEYLPLPTLADLFVFGRLTRAAWEGIFQACDEFLTTCAAWPGTADVQGLYLDKTLERLDRYAHAEGIGLDASCRFNGTALPSLRRMAAQAAAAVSPATPADMTLVHGDFCFSNILYDARANIVRAIDPRGLDAHGRFSLYGDRRYDLGKLYHSAVGLYDHIIAGHYRLDRSGPTDLSLELPDTPALRAIADSFLNTRFAGLSPRDAGAPAIAVLLFFSMLPLHADDRGRQAALLANGMRLFLTLDRAGGGPVR